MKSPLIENHPLFTSDLRERVARGAALLDRATPGWETEIHHELEMGSCQRCVLGYVFGNFFTGCEVLKAVEPSVDLWPSLYGFDTEYGAPTMEYTVLEMLWEAEIARRTPAPAAPPVETRELVDA
jgi:hypothetical protein